MERRTITIYILSALLLTGCMTNLEVGKKKVPPPATTAEKIIVDETANLRDTVEQLVIAQNEIKKLNQKLKKYEGKDIEGTGFSFSIMPLWLIIGIGILCVFPAIIPFLIMSIRKLGQTLKYTVEAVTESSNSYDIKDAMSQKMDNKHKRVASKYINFK